MNKIKKIIAGVLIGLGVTTYLVALTPKAIKNVKNRIEHTDGYLCSNAYNMLPKSFQFFLDKHDLSIVFIKKDEGLDLIELLGEYRQSSDNNIVIYKTGDYDTDLKTLFHELAHHFDYDFYKRTPMRISGRADFMNVYLKERDNVFQEGDHHYSNNEYFAWAVSEFYTDGSYLQEKCSKTYRWIKKNIDKPEDSYCNDGENEE